MRLAELFLQHGAQIIALDWVGIWWSLRLAHNGKDAGFKNVYIFGGEHADVELKPESGALMADLVVDKHISVVLDVMHFRKAERSRFATAFAEQFFHRKKTARTACHLFIEEAQAYLPQFVRGEEARMVGVFEDIGKVGRNYGIGNSLISQRPQAINKDVLNQIEVLLAFQTNGPQERKAIAGWTAENTTAGAAMIQQLPGLRVGHALAWSPQWLRIAEPVHITERITYNSSSTPTGAAKTINPKTLDKADLEQLGAEMNAIVERAKLESPAALKAQLTAKDKRISELEKAASGSAHLKEAKPTPVLLASDHKLLELTCEQLQKSDVRYREALDAATLTVEELLAKALQHFESKIRSAVVATDPASIIDRAPMKKVLAKLDQFSAARSQSSPLHTEASVNGPVSGGRVSMPPREVVHFTPSRNHGRPESGDLKAMHRAILTALAQHPAGLTKKKILIHTGYASSGPVSAAFAELGRSGFVEARGNELCVTSDGVTALGAFDPLPQGDELREWLLSSGKLSQMEAALLRAIAHVYPSAIRKAEVLTATGYASSGPVSAAFAKLTSLNYIESQGPSLVKASAELFS